MAKKTRRQIVPDHPLKIWLHAQAHGSKNLLAQRLRISVAAVNYWMNGTQLPRVNVAARLEQLTGISYATLQAWKEAYGVNRKITERNRLP